MHCSSTLITTSCLTFRRRRRLIDMSKKFCKNLQPVSPSHLLSLSLSHRLISKVLYCLQRPVSPPSLVLPCATWLPVFIQIKLHKTQKPKRIQKQKHKHKSTENRSQAQPSQLPSKSQASATAPAPVPACNTLKSHCHAESRSRLQRSKDDDDDDDGAEPKLSRG